MGNCDRPVQAPPDVLADYARSIGLTPPPEPRGYQGWAIVDAAAGTGDSLVHIHHRLGEPVEAMNAPNAPSR